MNDPDKAARLAAQLRENLRKRKAQARALEGGAPGEAGTPLPSNALDKKD